MNAHSSETSTSGGQSPSNHNLPCPSAKPSSTSGSDRFARTPKPKSQRCSGPIHGNTHDRKTTGQEPIYSCSYCRVDRTLLGNPTIEPNGHISRASYIFYGSAPWDAPWLTEHNLAHSLSKGGCNVLFVEPPMSVATPLRRGRSRTMRKLLHIRMRTRQGVSIIQPFVLPPVTNARAQALSTRLVGRQVRSATKRLGLERPVVVAARDTVTLAGPTDELCRVYLIKDWIQAGSDLLGRDEAELTREVRTLASWADISCSISPQLQRGLADEGVESTVLKHGFHAELADLYDRAQTPADIQCLSGPLLGYAGRVDERLDVDILVHLAATFRDATVVLVGPISPRFPHNERQRLLDQDNIVMLGPRARDALPAYVASFDCLLMPYRSSEWMKYGSPLKLWDYLYAGAPIIGSGCVALEDYSPKYLRFALDSRSFAAAVSAALEDGSAGRAERRAYAVENSWEARADQLKQLISSHVDGDIDVAAPSP